MRVSEDPRAQREFASFLKARGFADLPQQERDRLWEAFLWAWVPDQPSFRIVLDGPPAQPGENAGRFVEFEDLTGRSVRGGRWKEAPNGRWILEVAPSAGGGADAH